MRKLIVAEFISLDGVIQAPGGPEEDPSNGFRLGGWQVPYPDEAIGEAVMALFSQPFELLLGRRYLRPLGGVLAAHSGQVTQPPIRGPFQQHAQARGHASTRYA